MPQRVVIYVKDIMLVTGLKEGAARNLYRATLKFFDKQPKQLLTFYEFSIYTGIDEEVIQEYLYM